MVIGKSGGGDGFVVVNVWCIGKSGDGVGFVVGVCSKCVYLRGECSRCCFWGSNGFVHQLVVWISLPVPSL